jgi:membrane-bound lytic murein transglycosylase A
MHPVLFRPRLAAALACMLALIAPQIANAQQDLPSFAGDGRNTAFPVLERIFTRDASVPDAIPADPYERQVLRRALEAQGQIIAKGDPAAAVNFPGVPGAVNNGELARLVSALAGALDGGRALTEVADAYLLQGDGQGNVRFTSYFTPSIAVSSTRTDTYAVPVYRKPEGGPDPLPQRSQITDGALAGQGLELAWTDSAVDLFFLQVQGSGYGRYEDGSRALFSYGGKNGHPYVSIGKYLVSSGEIPVERISMASIRQWFADHPARVREVLDINPSYNFFVAGGSAVVGAAGVALTPLRSVAADSTVLPLGSVIVIEMPILGADGAVDHRQPQIMLVQDRGGAIKGTARVDIYAGGGPEAEVFAGNLKHFGRVWLLLPKKGG